MNEVREIILTAEGLKKVEEELDRLNASRREVAHRIRESKQYGAYGDSSEIASEYEDAKTEQAIIEGRIFELKSLLSQARVIREEEVPTDYVGVGSLVTVRDMETGEEWDWRIVGPIEASPEEDLISYESPVGKALLDARVGDIVEVSAPVGILRYQVMNIRK